MAGHPRFQSAAEMLDSFGMQLGGTQYRRLIAPFKGFFGATIFFGTESQREKAAVVHCARFNPPDSDDMEAAKVLSCSPAALDLFMWL